MSISPPIRCGYQGVPGAYSHQCLTEFLHKLNIEYVSIERESFSELFQSLINRDIHCFILPIENNIGGTVHNAVDLLVQHSNDIDIVTEIDFRVIHSLMVKDDDMSNLSNVYSHPQALAQCSEFIDLHGLKAIAEYDTAGSVKMLSNNQLPKGSCAIASKTTEIYGNVKALYTGIENMNNNHTKMILITNKDKSVSNIYHQPWHEYFNPDKGKTTEKEGSLQIKTKIMFTLENNVGELFNALKIFANNGLNLCKIESRPLRTQKNGICKQNLFKYEFLVDISEQQNNFTINTALTELKNICLTVTKLGSYSCDGKINLDSNFGKLISCRIDLEQYQNFINTEKSNHYSSLEKNTLNPYRYNDSSMNIGILGDGRFGTFFAKCLSNSCKVYLTGLGESSEIRRFFPGFNVQQMVDGMHSAGNPPDILIIAVAIQGVAEVLNTLTTITGLENTIVIDVCSVKVWPEYLFRTIGSKINCLGLAATHPLFGPHSGGKSLKDLRLIYSPIKSGKIWASVKWTNLTLSQIRNMQTAQNINICEDIAGLITSESIENQNVVTQSEHVSSESSNFVDLTTEFQNFHKFMDILAKQGVIISKFESENHDNLIACPHLLTYVIGLSVKHGSFPLPPEGFGAPSFSHLNKLINLVNSDSILLAQGIMQYIPNSKNYINQLKESLSKVICQLQNNNLSENS